MAGGWGVRFLLGIFEVLEKKLFLMACGFFSGGRIP
jgi:hypothetical protein